jgi:Carbohydrate family 9 binding domain-like/Secretion system C-terminal sorting domain
MRKIAFLLFIVVYTNTVLSQNSYTANKVSSLPVFDGNGNDGVWANANWQNIDQVWIPYNNTLPSNFTVESGTKILGGASDFSGKYKIVWSQDTSYLLFLVEIKDDAFIDGYQKPNSNYPNFDVLELFIDENKSGGNHLFDSNGNNAENAFAYHIAVNNPGVGNTATSMTGAMDFFGTSYGNIVDYQSHFPSFAFKNVGNGTYVYEFSLKVYKDTYSQVNPTMALKTLNVGDVLGLSIAYCDNDTADGLRDHFIGSVAVTGANNNNSYIDASIFGSLTLADESNLSTNENVVLNEFKIYPNPFSKTFKIEIPNELVSKSTLIKIFDLLGKEILNAELLNNETIIDISNFKSGLYVYKILAKNEVVANGKLIAN